MSDDLATRARAGDRAAFDTLASPHVAKLRAVIRRLVGHPEDTAELAQDAMLKAYAGIAGFRGEASFGTWLCAIGTNLAVDHLRSKKRWRARAQVIYANRCLESQDLSGEVVGSLTQSQYDAREHIAYCFTCVGRSLPPDEYAALVLRDVADMTNREAADALGITHSVLRHRLTAARDHMTEAFDGLCALVNKNGVCYQCEGLRQVAPEAHRGAPPPDVTTFDLRLAVVRAANVDSGRSQGLHDAGFRRIEAQEQAEVGDADDTTTCGKP